MQTNVSLSSTGLLRVTEFTGNKFWRPGACLCLSKQACIQQRMCFRAAPQRAGRLATEAIHM